MKDPLHTSPGRDTTSRHARWQNKHAEPAKDSAPEGQSAKPTSFDQFLEAVKRQMQPEGRALHQAGMHRYLGTLLPQDVTLADLVAGWQVLVDRKAVGHRMQAVHPWHIQSWKRRTDRDGACRNHQPIIGELEALPRLDTRLDNLVMRVDLLGPLVESQHDTLCLYLWHGAVGEFLPLGHFTAQIKGQPTNAVVGKVVGYDHCHLDGGLNFAYSQGRADARITAADDEQVRHADSSSALAAA